MTFTRLTLGEPRLRGKIHGGEVSPCVEPLIHGTNILLDQGLEAQLAQFTGGPNGDEIPAGEFVIDPEKLVWPSDQSSSPQELTWAQSGFGFGILDAAEWTVATADPHQGTYHARLRRADNGAATSADAQLLYPLIRQPCDPSLADFFSPHGYQAIVSPGDLVTWSIYAKATVLGSDPSIRLEGETYDSDGTFIEGFHTEDLGGSSLGDIFLSTTYENYSLPFVVPSASHFLRVWVRQFFEDQTAPAFVDIDTAQLEVI